VQSIVFLYSLITPSVSAVLKELVERYKVNLVVYYWDKGGNKPFELKEVSGIKYIPSSKLSARQISDEVLSIAPAAVYVTAWQERKYLEACRKMIRKGVPVIAGFDDNWINSFRQRVGSLVVRSLRKWHFSHAMVSGPRQYHYAMRFGFRDSQILYYLFSADTSRFRKAANSQTEPRNAIDSFIFIGRYTESKGIETLAQAFAIYRSKLAGKLKLKCFGNGVDSNLLEKVEGVEVNGYVGHEAIQSVCNNAIAFVLPSIYDPSPLVVHEMALSGMPLLLSENVGNRHMFLINGFNGYTFQAGDPHDLARRLKDFEELSERQLNAMRQQSVRLAEQHNPTFTAASIMSVVSRG
jgi:glycosyltransferase involved in cell wall biosynthesis